MTLALLLITFLALTLGAALASLWWLRNEPAMRQARADVQVDLHRIGQSMNAAQARQELRSIDRRVRRELDQELREAGEG